MAPSMTAASRTVRVKGPAVSWLCDIGTMPRRLTRPTVGFKPTMPLIEAGLTIDPSVSVPTAAAQRFAETATAEPELEPDGVRSVAYGFRHWPPRPLQPLKLWVERKLAHSLKFVLPKITAPAARRRCTSGASLGAYQPCRASDPAVDII